MNDKRNCDIHNIIRPSSSSLIRAPSWSLGVGANLKDYDDEGQETTNDGSNGRSPDTEADHSSSSESASPYPKLSLQIPFVYLIKKESSSASHHVYQIAISTSTNCSWSIYRRYSQFYELHQQLKARDPIIGKIHFPPKRRLNSKASTIVQDRRRKLEDYMQLLNTYVERLPASLDASQPLQDMLDVHRPSSSRSARVSETNSLSDSVDSEQLASNSQPDSATDASQRGLSSSDVDTSQSMKLSVRSLFHNFISLREKKDEQFDETQLDRW